MGIRTGLYDHTIKVKRPTTPSRTVAEAVQRSRASINPHAGFNAPRQRPDFSIGSNAEAAQYGSLMDPSWSPSASTPAPNRPNFSVPNAQAARDLSGMMDPSWSPSASTPAPNRPDFSIGSNAEAAQYGALMDPSWSPSASTQPRQTPNFSIGSNAEAAQYGALQDPSWSPISGPPQFTEADAWNSMKAPMGVTAGQPQQRNPFGPLTGEQGDVSGAAFNNPHLGEEEMANTPFGGWMDQGDPGNSPYGGWADVQQLNDPGMGMVDPSWGQKYPDGGWMDQGDPGNSPYGGWADEGDPGMMARDAEFMPDPRDTQQVFNHTNKLMDDARTEKEKEASRVVAEAAAAEATARYGGSDAETSKRADYIADMNRMFNRQRIMMVLAAISGDPDIMAMAEQSARMETAQMDFNYGEFKNERLAKMRDMLLFDSEGRYSPPQDEAEFYNAMKSMGATSAEMDALKGGLPKDEDSATKNWVDANGNRVSAIRSPGPQWQEAGLAEGAKNPDATKGSDTGTKGAQLTEIKDLRARHASAVRLSGKNSPEAIKAMEDLQLAEEMYGLSQKDPSMTTTYLGKLYSSILGEFKKGLGGAINWKKFNEKYGTKINSVGEYAEWFEDTHMSGVNNAVTVDPATGITDGSLGDGPSEEEIATYPVVNSQSEVDALAVGTRFRDSNGNWYEKE